MPETDGGRGQSIEEVRAWPAGLEALHARIAGRFARAEPRRRAAGVPARAAWRTCERKNGWQLAEHAGEATPDGMQRLLASADWDADAVRDDLRGYVRGAPGRPGGGAGRRRDRLPEEGHQVGRGAAPVLGHGRTDRELPGRGVPGLRQPARAGVDRPGAVPAQGVDRRRRPPCRAPACPTRSGSRPSRSWPGGCSTRALDAGVPAAWVTADEVYGGDPGAARLAGGAAAWPTCWRSSPASRLGGR